MSNLSFQKEIRTILVDDEDIALHRFKHVLEAYPFIKIIAEAKDGKSAIELINALKPDLVFLDIQMPEFTGFEVLNHLGKMPVIVFVSAYEEYAIRAFEKNSLDYLLKPVDEDRLAITIDRILQKEANESDTLLKIRKLLLEVETKKTISTLTVKTGNKINLIHIPDICYFEAREKYVFIHTKEKEYLIDYSLGFLAERLPDEFIRVHRSYLLNTRHIKEMHKYFKGSYIFIMNDIQETKIKAANSYSGAIKQQLLIP